MSKKMTNEVSKYHRPVLQELTYDFSARPTVRLSTPSSDFVIFCSGIENLRHFSEEKGVYSFIWDTPYACPTNFKILADQPDDEVPPEEEKEGNDDLMPQGGMSTIRKLMIAAFFTLV